MNKKNLVAECTANRLRVVSEATLERREKRDKKPIKVVVNFNQNGFCKNKDIDNCPHRCGACQYGEIPKLAIYMV